jgi:predicted NUDIX family NTP pyrophosphohydrolase
MGARHEGEAIDGVRFEHREMAVRWARADSHARLIARRLRKFSGGRQTEALRLRPGRPDGARPWLGRLMAARSLPKLSAGILAYRRRGPILEVLLVHPGGPFWRNKDDGAWSIPKGEIDGAEDPEMAARREFAEELGPSASIGPLQNLGEVRQRGGKRVIAFCGEGDFDPATLSSNRFEIEWPPWSGRMQSFQEVDRAEWLDLETAKAKILSGQLELLDRLRETQTWESR